MNFTCRCHNYIPCLPVNNYTTIYPLSDNQFKSFLHVELSHDDLRQIGMEKKQDGDPSHQSKPTEEVKQSAVSGNASQCSVLFCSVRKGHLI